MIPLKKFDKSWNTGTDSVEIICLWRLYGIAIEDNLEEKSRESKILHHGNGLCLIIS